ncbi:hypothetical protein B0G83_102523 [Paraburkholderia sp. BL21I4N1]|nr:hypothetical protein B0G83_102523 [Paraburkholderia sp. BL21I4N1]
MTPTPPGLRPAHQHLTRATPNLAEGTERGSNARFRAVPWHGLIGCYSGGGAIEKYKWLAT